MKNYSLVKAFDRADMPKKVNDFFEKNHAEKNLNFSIFQLDSVEGKTKDHYRGKKIICKWTIELKKNVTETLIIERGDDILFDWLIDNGLDIKKDDFIVIKH
jgi:hypothetical protein